MDGLEIFTGVALIGGLIVLLVWICKILADEAYDWTDEKRIPECDTTFNEVEYVSNPATKAAVVDIRRKLIAGEAANAANSLRTGLLHQSGYAAPGSGAEIVATLKRAGLDLEGYEASFENGLSPVPVLAPAAPIGLNPHSARLQIRINGAWISMGDVLALRSRGRGRSIKVDGRSAAVDAIMRDRVLGIGRIEPVQVIPFGAATSAPHNIEVRISSRRGQTDFSVESFTAHLEDVHVIEESVVDGPRLVSWVHFVI